MLEEPFTLEEGILHHTEGVDLMPGNIELSALKVSLVNTMSRETVLRGYIRFKLPYRLLSGLRDVSDKRSQLGMSNLMTSLACTRRNLAFFHIKIIIPPPVAFLVSIPSH